jgi:serpin B
MKQSLLALLGSLMLTSIAVTAQLQSLVSSNRAFALNLYGQLAANHSSHLFFSPYSISTCLAMLYAVASGNAEAQMSQVLGFGNHPQQWATTFGRLAAELATDQQTKSIQLDIASALWTQEGFPFLPAFLETATNQYQANLGQADFTTPTGDHAATQTINNWVGQETQNKIQNTKSWPFLALCLVRGCTRPGASFDIDLALALPCSW